ncbi:MAG: type II toxin-antitoxin system VapC family toxin [Bifidobacteriaceae bacterium]|nr:type II toxin-antitoxin system VapC family toxin [Bifidobacteriaceae bacterium]
MSRLVVDASAVLAALLTEDGDLAAARMAETEMAAPHLLPFDVANVVRRWWSAGVLTQSAAELALDSFGLLDIELWPFEAVASRVWARRGRLTAYDASYVALAELLGCPLLTGDARLVGAVRAGAPEVSVEVV